MPTCTLFISNSVNGMTIFIQITNKLTSFFVFNRFMDSVTVLITQKERTVSVVRQVIMTGHGDLQLLKTPMNVEVGIFSDKMALLFKRWITLSIGKITIQ